MCVSHSRHILSYPRQLGLGQGIELDKTLGKCVIGGYEREKVGFLKSRRKYLDYNPFINWTPPPGSGLSNSQKCPYFLYLNWDQKARGKARPLFPTSCVTLSWHGADPLSASGSFLGSSQSPSQSTGGTWASAGGVFVIRKWE